MAKPIAKNERMAIRRALGNRPWKPKAPAPPPGRLYVVAHACFACKKSFQLGLNQGAQHPCPQCRSPLYEMGRSFKAPRSDDLEQWHKVQGLYALGFRFWSYGYGRPPALPARLKDVPSFVASNPKHPCLIAERNDDLLPLALIGAV